MKKLICMALFAVAAICHAQTDNTFYVKTFQGLDVGSKVLAASGACSSNTAIPCYLIIDPSLSQYVAGTLPSLRGNIYVIDYRTNPFTGATVNPCSGQAGFLALFNGTNAPCVSSGLDQSSNGIIGATTFDFQLNPTGVASMLSQSGSHKHNILTSGWDSGVSLSVTSQGAGYSPGQEYSVTISGETCTGVNPVALAMGAAGGGLNVALKNPGSGCAVPGTISVSGSPGSGWAGTLYDISAPVYDRWSIFGNYSGDGSNFAPGLEIEAPSSPSGALPSQFALIWAPVQGLDSGWIFNWDGCPLCTVTHSESELSAPRVYSWVDASGDIATFTHGVPQNGDCPEWSVTGSVATLADSGAACGTGNAITSLTGDATAAGPGAASVTLATVNSNVGACGDATHVGQATFNAKGLATGCVPVAITSGSGSPVVFTVNSLTSTLRPFGTVFQNTSAYPILVMATDANSSTPPKLITDSSSTPSTVVFSSQTYTTSGGGASPVVGVVMPGNYYEVTGTTFAAWSEVDFQKGTWADSGDIVGSRSFGTIFHNTGSGILMVEAQYSASAGYPNAACEIGTSPSLSGGVDVWMNPTTATIGSAFCIVPQGYYYALNQAGSITLTHWREITGSVSVQSLVNLTGLSQRAGSSTQTIGSTGYRFVAASTSNEETSGTSNFYVGDTNPFVGTATFSVSTLNGGSVAPATGIGFAIPGQLYELYRDSGSGLGSSFWIEYNFQ